MSSTRFSPHDYGDNFFILNNPRFNTLLAELCSPRTVQPRVNVLTERLYCDLLDTALEQEFTTQLKQQATRMSQKHPRAQLKCLCLNPQQKVVTVNIARAGALPSQVCFNELHHYLKPECIRQDHIFASRKVDKKNRVVGTDLSAAKIGGDKAGAILLFPDPMGATGNTLIEVIKHYKKNVRGKEKKIIALHLIVTPEYLVNIKKHMPDLIVFAGRVDRGLSSQRALKAKPGKYKSEERGLDDNSYIVPGAGGLGELLNNAES